MTVWLDYMAGKNPQYHSVVGTLRLAPQVYSPQLDNRRDLLVYLPPSYHTSTRTYPVLYMHDGQNLFDRATSYVGEWQVDETLEGLAQEGVEAIVVGIANGGEARIEEYSPFPSRWGAGKGDAYLAFLAETVKPLIDQSFRTMPHRMHTGIAGSSMGGLISLYGYFRYPQVFGLAGVMSPSLWITGGKITEFIEQQPVTAGRLYLDIGTQEISWRRGAVNAGQAYANAVRRLYDLLLSKGYTADDQVKYVEDPEGIHHEAAWARRLPEMLRYLLAPQPEWSPGTF